MSLPLAPPLVKLLQRSMVMLRISRGVANGFAAFEVGCIGPIIFSISR